jgi:hypothetical protein
MLKFKTIDSFFKMKEADISESNTQLDFNAETSNVDECHFIDIFLLCIYYVNNQIFKLEKIL